MFNYLQPLPSCLQLFQISTKFLCYLFMLECDPESNQIIPACREMCYDYIELCDYNWKHINCRYLPSLNKEFQSFYEPIICRTPPPIVKHARLLIDVGHIPDYYFPAVVEYNCHERFKMKGNKTIRCDSNGHWSTPPQCSPKYLTTKNQTEKKAKKRTASEDEFTGVTSNQTVTNTELIAPAVSTKKSMKKFNTDSTAKLMINFLVVASLLVLLVLLFVMVAVRYKIKFKREKKLGLKRRDVLYDIELKERDVSLPLEGTKDPEVVFLPRKRTFDATIFYHFDSDDDFVLNHLLPELEEARDFKLCIHNRNFTPGRDIKDNIEEAIVSSNSAIIIMSQGFVDSMWCKEEFTHCYIENMKDAAFNLFVIMIQPADTLVNISNYMKTFFANKTYLDVNDPELFTKLAVHLKNARQSEEDYVEKV